MFQIITLFLFVLATPSWGNSLATWQTELNSYKLQISNSDATVAQNGIQRIIAMMNQALLPTARMTAAETHEILNSALQVLTHDGFSHEDAGVRNLAALSFGKTAPSTIHIEDWRWLANLQSALDQVVQSNNQRARDTGFYALAQFAGMSEHVMSEYDKKYGSIAFAFVHPFDSYSQWAFTKIFTVGLERNGMNIPPMLPALRHFTRIYHDGPNWALDQVVTLSLRPMVPPSILESLPQIFKLLQGTDLLSKRFINRFLENPVSVTTPGGALVLNLLSSPEYIAQNRTFLTEKIKDCTTSNNKANLSDLSIAEVIFEDVNRQFGRAAQSLLDILNRLAVQNTNCAGSLGETAGS